MREQYKHLPLRSGVGIVVLNQKNEIFVARRIDSPKNFWQMPQGGIDEGENFLSAAYRELKEETSITKVKLIKELNPNTAVEALTPDFKGLSSSIHTLVNCGLEVFAQNIETVERLTHQVRDIRAGYQQTLDVLAKSKDINPSVLTKTSIILGLGETDKEIEKTMDDLIKNKVDILTIGQYLRPTRNHHPIERWVTPEEFERYRKIGLEKGFLEVVSGPMVRSSYRAERALQKNNAGL